MRRPAVILVLAGLFTASTLASAQGGMRGQPRGEFPQSLGSMMGSPPPIPPSVATLVLDHANDFQLADSQRVVLESVRRAQDSANMPWMAKLDSLRPTRQSAGGPGDLSQEQRDELETRKIAIANVLEGMRETNAQSRKKVMDVLNPDQQKRAANLEEDARKKAEEEGKRRERDAQGGGRRRGRPTED
ncbi:MAG: hypothetical protein ABI625_11180 [bacterium]